MDCLQSMQHSLKQEALAFRHGVVHQYDMRKLKVVSIQPRFERFGPDYMGMEFTVIGLKNKEEK